MATITEQINWLYKQVNCLLSNSAPINQNNLLQVVEVAYDSTTTTLIDAINSQVLEVTEREILIFNVLDTSNAELSKYMSKVGKGTYGMSNTLLTLDNLETFAGAIVSGGTSYDISRTGSNDTVNNLFTIVLAENATPKTTLSLVQPTGLEAIDESNGIGWRLIGRDPTDYENAGLNSVDFSVSTGSKITGASGLRAFTAGYDNLASGAESLALGGHDLIASGDYSAVVGGTLGQATGSFAFIGGGQHSGFSSELGRRSSVSGYAASTIGGGNLDVTGDYGFATGIGNFSKSYAEAVFGSYSTIYTPTSMDTYVSTDRLFTIGNGSISTNRRDALIILKNGLATLPSVTNGLIDAAGDDAIVTKGWFNANNAGGGGVDLAANYAWTGLHSFAQDVNLLENHINNVNAINFKGGGLALGTITSGALTGLEFSGINGVYIEGSKLVVNTYVTTDMTNADIDTASPGVLITKDWFLANTGLEAIDEGNGVGYRTVGKDPNDFGNIGFGAVDFGSSSAVTDGGALGTQSFNLGADNKAEGFYAQTIGYLNNVNGNYSTAYGTSINVTGENSIAVGSGITITDSLVVAMGALHNVSGYAGTAFGYDNSVTDNYASSFGVLNQSLQKWGGTFGAGLYANDDGVVVVGTNNTEYAQSGGLNNPLARKFIVGIGDMAAGTPVGLGTKKDGLIVYHGGEIVAPELTIAKIDAESTNKVLITKEYADANYSGGGGDFTKVGTTANNQIMVATGDGLIEGTSGLTYDGVNLSMFGFNIPNYQRFIELENSYIGGYVGWDGVNNNLILGTHNTANTDPSNDIPAITIARGSEDVLIAGVLTANAVNIGGAGANVLLDNGTTTPLSGLGGVTKLLQSSLITTSRNSVLADINGVNVVTAASDITITIDDSVAYEEGHLLHFQRIGAGNVIIAYGGSYTGPSVQTYYNKQSITLRLTNVANTWEVTNLVSPQLETIEIATSDLTTDLVTGTDLGFMNIPFDMEITEVRQVLFDAGTVSGITTDINVNGSTILSTKLTTDATEETSDTAATPAVLSSTSLSKGDRITVDHDAVGTGQKGASTQIIGYRL